MRFCPKWHIGITSVLRQYRGGADFTYKTALPAHNSQRICKSVGEPQFKFLICKNICLHFNGAVNLGLPMGLFSYMSQPQSSF